MAFNFTDEQSAFLDHDPGAPARLTRRPVISAAWTLTRPTLAVKLRTSPTSHSLPTTQRASGTTQSFHDAICQTRRDVPCVNV